MDVWVAGGHTEVIFEEDEFGVRVDLCVGWEGGFEPGDKDLFAGFRELDFIDCLLVGCSEASMFFE